ncbi:RNA uridylyltransferase [Bertholletia excelsa]
MSIIRLSSLALWPKWKKKLKISVLCKKAKQLEVEELQKKKINLEHVPALEEILHDVYAICRPKDNDYYNRKDLVRIFNEIAREIYGKSIDVPVVEEFGSFLMDIFSAKSDLDLSVNFSDNTVDFPREKKIQALRKFAKKIYALQRRGHVSHVQPIFSAKVPILKVVDRGTGIECDISIENRDGIVKSQIIRMISLIDTRFQMLSFLMKAWAKAHGINSSRNRTLNSLSIISLVAFHLQTRNPPILPPFSAILKCNYPTSDGTGAAPVEKIISKFLNYGKRNEESLVELFVTLLIKLASVERLWGRGLCASIYKGSWILKKWDSKCSYISVEDFTDRSQNVARAVGKKEIKKIYRCIHLSICNIFAFMDGKIQGIKLAGYLFGQEVQPSLVDKCTTNFGKRTIDNCITLDSIQAKKVRLNGNWGAEQASPQVSVQMASAHSTEVWKGSGSWGAERAIPSSNIQTVNTCSMEGWRANGCWGTANAHSTGGLRGSGCGGPAQAIPSINDRTAHTCSTEVWRGKGCWGTEKAIPSTNTQTVNIRSMEGWRGSGSWGTANTCSTGGWGGNGSWGTKQAMPSTNIQTANAHSDSIGGWRGQAKEGWGAWHGSPTVSWVQTREPIVPSCVCRKEKQCAREI